MSRTAEDIALLQAPIPLGKNGIQSIVDFWHNATHEVRNILANECDIIFQCKICDNFFRSLLNFISHKRSFCRTLYGVKNELNLKACSRLTEEIAEHMNSFAADDSHVLKKPRGLLKRTSIVGMLNKRIEHAKVTSNEVSGTVDVMTLPRITKSVPLTTFDHGEQILKTMPEQLALDDLSPKVRTALVMPQDNNVQYREMNLRRRDNNQKDSVAREITTAEVEILYRLENYVPSSVDFCQLRCLHPFCVSNGSFFSISALAYHISVKHNRRSTMTGAIQCFICGGAFFRYSELIKHLGQVHETVREDQRTFRDATLVEKNHKKCKKSKVPPVNANCNFRSRSLSPLATDYIPDDNAFNGYDEYHEDHGFLDGNNVFHDLYNKAVSSIINAVDVNPDGYAKLLSDEKRLTECRSEVLREPLAACQRGGTTLNQILRFLQISSKLGTFGEIKMKHCKQVVLDCVESIIDRVCELERMDTVKNIVTVNADNKSFDKVVCTDNAGISNSDRSKILGICNTEMKDVYAYDARDIEDVHRCLNKFLVPNGHETQLIMSRDCNRNIEEHNGKKCIIKVKSEEDQMSSSGTGSLITADGLENYKITESCEVGSPSYINEDSLHLQDIQSHQSGIEEGLHDSDQDYKGDIEMQASFSCRPIRQRRRPNWIDRESFMTLNYGKRKRRRDWEGSNVKDEFIPSKIGGFSGNFTNYAQIDCQTTTVIGDNRKTACSSDSSPGRATYCSIFSCDQSGSKASVDNECPTSSKKIMSSLYCGSFESHNFKDTFENGYTGPSTSTGDLVCDEKPGSILDPAKIPVYLTETQRELLFSFILPFRSSGEQLYKCMHCLSTFPDIKEGRLHAVDHIRIIRLRCSLCGSGSFYCSAMRDHLRMRHCPMLSRAPKQFVLPTGEVPCMTCQDADSLIEVVDKAKPGRIAFTSGKIISSEQLAPHIPDPKIEKLILGSRQTDGDWFLRKYDSLHIKFDP